MISISALWLPILLAAVIVFVASSVIHMTPPLARGRFAWKLTLKSALDGLIYALLTAGTFGWLWPR